MKYPIDLQRYLQSVGRLLAHRIGQIFEELGFVSWIAKGQSNGVDLIIKDREGNLVLVAEIINWCPYSELSPTRKNSMISNLGQYNCRKLLIYTALKNEGFLDNLGGFGISLLKIGHQLLPRFFYEHFRRMNQVEQRKIETRETKEDIKTKVVTLLQSFSA